MQYFGVMLGRAEQNVTNAVRQERASIESLNGSPSAAPWRSFLSLAGRSGL